MSVKRVTFQASKKHTQKPLVNSSTTQWDRDTSVTTKIPEKDTCLRCLGSPSDFVLKFHLRLKPIYFTPFLLFCTESAFSKNLILPPMVWWLTMVFFKTTTSVYFDYRSKPSLRSYKKSLEVGHRCPSRRKGTRTMQEPEEAPGWPPI